MKCSMIREKCKVTVTVISISLIAVLICLLTQITMTANAAEETEAELVETDTSNAVYLECALDASALMVAQAIQKDVIIGGGESYWDFQKIDFASPLKAAVIFPSEQNISQLCQRFDTQESELAIALADFINEQFDMEYAFLAKKLQIEDNYSRNIPADEKVIVVLFYERDISITFMIGDDISTNGSEYNSSFIISDDIVEAGADRTYILDKIRELGIEDDVPLEIYDSSLISEIYSASSTTAVQELTDTTASTKETFLKMVPTLLLGNTYGHNDNISIEKIASSYVNQRSDDGKAILEAIKDVREMSQEVMAQVDDSWSWDWLSISTKEETVLPPIEKAAAFPADKTIIIVTRSAREEYPVIDYSCESLLPEKNIPSSPDEADYILLIDSDWEYQKTSNDIDVYDCKTVISLHDAATGEMAGIIGTSFNTLSGFVMVSGSEYYPKVDYDDVKHVINAWIEGQ